MSLGLRTDDVGVTLAGEVNRLRKKVQKEKSRANDLKRQRDLWKGRYENERRQRLALERTLVQVGREAA